MVNMARKTRKILKPERQQRVEELMAQFQAPQELASYAEAMEQVARRERKKTGKLQARNAELQDMLDIDHLTDVYNKRAFDRDFPEIFRHVNLGYRTERGEPCRFGLIVCDLDNFKLFNDTNGHMTGDLLLEEVGNAMKKCMRHGKDGRVYRTGGKQFRDSVYRVGGEEFAVLVYGADEAGTYRVAERLREAVKGILVENGEGVLSTTMSFGVAAYPSSLPCVRFARDTGVDVDKRETLYDMADLGAYEAKGEKSSEDYGDKVFLPACLRNIVSLEGS